jgi:ATP-binding cassette subfamily C protein CydD
MLLSRIVDGVFLRHQTLADVSFLLALMAMLLAVRALLNWAGDAGAQAGANKLKSRVRARLVARLIELGPVFTRGERTGELVHAAVEGIEALDEYMSLYQPARLLASSVPLLVLAAVVLIDPWTALVLLFAGPVLLFLLALIGARTKELTARRFREMAWMSAHFLDILRGLETLKLFGRSKEQAASIERISRRFASTTMDVLRTAFQTSLVLEWAATAATALVAIEVSLRLMAGGLQFGRALTLLLITPEFFLPWRHLAMKYHAGATGRAAAERVYEILDTAPLIHVPVPPLTIPAGLGIRFENVSVVYEEDREPALSGINLLIPQGQKLAIVGETGAGKSTLASLLLRFVEPTCGRIMVGGVPLDQIDPDEWRKYIAWLPQHPYIFAGTIGENICMGAPNADRQAMLEAAEAANASEFIERLPQGYETPAGERGIRLSGGQRQRIALARTLLKRAPILILDEPVAQLDAGSEEAVRTGLARFSRHRTVITITHQHGPLQEADRVIAISGGRVLPAEATATLRNKTPASGPAEIAAAGAS